jgi:hypothetical protein
MSSISLRLSPGQLPLVQFVESDDRFLDECDVVWFRTLRDLDWRPFVAAAVQYYEALWQFNQEQLEARTAKVVAHPVPDPETEEQARQRLLLDRATLDATKPVIAAIETSVREPAHVNPDAIRPGHVPLRIRGRTPKDFFAMLKAFLGVMLMGRPAEPEFVHDELTGNPAFARTCGFTLPEPACGYRATDIPRRRKLEQFDQIMTKNGLWDALALGQVRRNIESGKLGEATIGVHDTTHHLAFSSMEVPVVEGRTKNGKPLRKSHPRTTKNCRCENREVCPHEWISADDGAGTVVKAGGKMYWGHKASTFALAGLPEIPLDLVALTDAATHDSRSLLPQLERISIRFPSVIAKVKIVLDDGALDDDAIRKMVKEKFDMDLVVKPNPRGRNAMEYGLPKGIDHVTPTGTPVCRAGFPFDLLGTRKETGHFLFTAPDASEGVPVCTDCALREDCIRPNAERRHISIPCEMLPFMDPVLPHLSKRFARLTAKRTVIERIHKLMKYDYGRERLTKRGTAAYQATLDKTLLAMHIVLAHD